MVSNGGESSSDEWKDFDFSTVDVEKARATRVLPKQEILRILVVGLLGGAVVWLMYLALENWAIKSLFCGTPDTANVCTNASLISFVIALVVTGIIAATILASMRVFRAIVITAATFVSLGALWSLLNTRGTVVATLLTAVFATGLYLFFALIASVKRYVLAAALLIVLVTAFWFLAQA